ncbi:riboflavin synthase [Serpentinimonas barnesii]|uniref:riboflavin synthase n=1 Tax=Serpentinimonas barnesii TaxID=1458427 RepID=UPI000494EBB6|nr:riboflavin synthase [Serpentinimonas barnesii]
MFTGIITGVGRITAVHPLGPSAQHGKRLCIQTPPGYLAGVGLGDSIALNGACMTVTTLDLAAHAFTVEVSAESLAHTAGLDAPGPVNLEQALRAHDRLGGHIVTGHVDAVGRVLHFAPVGESWALRLLAPAALGKFLATKGSITVNGVSLTVNAVFDRPEGCECHINLIGHTLTHTTLGQLQAGQPLNLEIDLIARYVARMLPTAP